MVCDGEGHLRHHNWRDGGINSAVVPVCMHAPPANVACEMYDPSWFQMPNGHLLSGILDAPFVGAPFICNEFPYILGGSVAIWLKS